MRRIKNLENTCRTLETHGENLSQEKQDLEDKLKQIKEAMNDNFNRFNKEVRR